MVLTTNLTLKMIPANSTPKRDTNLLRTSTIKVEEMHYVHGSKCKCGCLPECYCLCHDPIYEQKTKILAMLEKVLFCRESQDELEDYPHWFKYHVENIKQAFEPVELEEGEEVPITYSTIQYENMIKAFNHEDYQNMYSIFMNQSDVLFEIFPINLRISHEMLSNGNLVCLASAWYNILGIVLTWCHMCKFNPKEFAFTQMTSNTMCLRSKKIENIQIQLNSQVLISSLNLHRMKGPKNAGKQPERFMYSSFPEEIGARGHLLAFSSNSHREFQETMFGFYVSRIRQMREMLKIAGWCYHSREDLCVPDLMKFVNPVRGTCENIFFRYCIIEPTFSLGLFSDENVGCYCFKDNIFTCSPECKNGPTPVEEGKKGKFPECTCHERKDFHELYCGYSQIEKLYDLCDGGFRFKVIKRANPDFKETKDEEEEEENPRKKQKLF